MAASSGSGSSSLSPIVIEIVKSETTIVETEKITLTKDVVDKKNRMELV